MQMSYRQRALWRLLDPKWLWVCLCFLFGLWLAPLGLQAASPEIHGRVLGPGGHGLDKARIEILPVLSTTEQAFRTHALLESPTSAGEDLEEETRSGPDGSYSVSAAAGIWRVRVSSQGLSTRCLTLLPLLQATRIPTVKLEPSPPLELEVVDGHGAPLPGALIRALAEPSNEMKWGACQQEALTDENGRALLHGVQRQDDGATELAIYRPGFRDAAVEVRGEAQISLRPSQELNLPLQVTDPSATEDRPKPQILAVSGKEHWPIAASDEQGELVLATLPGPGTELQLMTADGRRSPIQLSAQVAHEPMTFTLSPVRVFTGKTQEVHVNDAGETYSVSVPEAVIWDEEDLGNWTLSGNDGRYRLFNAETEARPAGPWINLRARATGYQPTDIEMVLEPPVRKTTVEGAHLVFDELHFWLSSAKEWRTVSGRIVDEQGTPVQGATIRLVRGPSPTAGHDVAFALAGIGSADPSTDKVGMSDAEGFFSLRSLPGHKSLVASHPEMAPAVVPVVEVSPAIESTSVGEITLTSGWTVTGTVNDTSGEPLPGATVQVTYPASSPDGTSVVHPPDQRREPVITDPAGAFRISRLPHLDVALKAQAPGFVPSVTLVRPERSDSVTLTLEGAARLAGRILNETGETVSNAEIRLIPEDATRSPGAPRQQDPVDTVVSGSDGRFELDLVRPGHWQLSVQAEDYAPHQVSDLEVAAGEMLSGLEVRLQRGVKVWGRVMTPEGTPVPDATVRAADQRVLSEGDGSFRFFEPLAPGQLLVEADHDDVGLAEKLVSLSPGEGERQVELILQPGLSIRGHAVDPEGRGIKGVLVKLTPEYPVTADYQSSDEHGGFHFRNVEPGRYTLSGRTGKCTGQTEIEVTDQPRSAVELTIYPRGRLRGQVTGLSDDELQRVFVKCANGDGSVECFTPVDESGNFETTLPLGTWSIVASLTGTDRSTLERVILSGDIPEAKVTLHFEPGRDLHAQLLHNGRPLINAQVRLLAGEALTATTWTGWQGEFSFEGVVDATGVEILPESREFRVRIPVERIDGGPLRIETHPLEGVVVTSDGSPVGYTAMALVPLEFGPSQTVRTADLRLLETDAKGAFSLRQVPVGSYRLEVLDDGASIASIRLEVGNVTSSTLRLVVPLSGSEGPEGLQR